MGAYKCSQFVDIFRPVWDGWTQDSCQLQRETLASKKQVKLFKGKQTLPKDTHWPFLSRTGLYPFWHSSTIKKAVYGVAIFHITVNGIHYIIDLSSMHLGLFLSHWSTICCLEVFNKCWKKSCSSGCFEKLILFLLFLQLLLIIITFHLDSFHWNIGHSCSLWWPFTTIKTNDLLLVFRRALLTLFNYFIRRQYWQFLLWVSTEIYGL